MNDPYKRDIPASKGSRIVLVHVGSRNQGLIPNCELLFQSHSTDNRDYYTEMEGPVFKQQLQEKILPFLDRPSCLVMNNASSYHNVVSVSQEDKLPTSSSTKREIKEWLQTKNIHVTSLKLELFIIHSKAAEEAPNL